MSTRSIALTTTGADGSATAAVTVPASGYVVAVGIDYRAQPATTDVTLTAIDANGIERAIFARSDSNTDLALTNLVNDPMDEAGAAFTTSPSAPYVDGSLRVNVAGGDNGESLAVIVAIERPAQSL